VVLLVDVSGSMRGEKVRIAAATVGALAPDLASDQLALVAFWKDAAVLDRLDGDKTGTQLVAELLRIPARGLTNLHFALTVGRSELTRGSGRHAMAVLLSDCVHNAGPDPRLVAPRLPRLHVLLETDGEHDAPLAADLARLGRGQVAPIRTYRDVAPAINRLLAG
jgi:Mg-chelatase subunit ChlD